MSQEESVVPRRKTRACARYQPMTAKSKVGPWTFFPHEVAVTGPRSIRLWQLHRVLEGHGFGAFSRVAASTEK